MEVGHHLGLAGAGGEPTERIIAMQEYTPKKARDSGAVNMAIPGPAEPRWVVAVLDYGTWELRRYNRDPEPELVRILDPKSGEAASRYDSGTWADLDRARNACGTSKFRGEMHESLDYKNRAIFVDDDARLRYPDGRSVLESAEDA